MAKRRGTPREPVRSSPILGRERNILLALAVLAVILVIVAILSRCTGTEEAAAPTSRDAGDAPVVVEQSSEEAREREEFAEAWAPRIDAFNEGYPLEGYGMVFAYAAYDYGVDPRIAPAIARVESGSGENCFLAYNAWGWGEASWPDWETAIRAFVRGYSEGYGGEVTYGTAEVYNQANVDEWYALVTSYMEEI